jgi:hypothetical protein
MSDGISFFSNDDLTQNVKKVMSQTNYTEEQAIEKLKLFNAKKEESKNFLENIKTYNVE